MGGRLTFSSEAAHGRIGRAFTAAIINAHPQFVKKIEEQPRAQWALGWWAALLQHPLARREHYLQGTMRAIMFPDGYWAMEEQQGGVGVFAMDDQGAFYVGDMIPEHIARQLRTFVVHDPKKQRNSQAELLAILCTLLTWPHRLRGSEIVIYDDSESTIGAVLAGSSADEHSKELVALIWQTLALLQCPM